MLCICSSSDWPGMRSGFPLSGDMAFESMGPYPPTGSTGPYARTTGFSANCVKSSFARSVLAASLLVATQAALAGSILLDHNLLPDVHVSGVMF